MKVVKNDNLRIKKSASLINIIVLIRSRLCLPDHKLDLREL